MPAFGGVTGRVYYKAWRVPPVPCCTGPPFGFHLSG
jgi:hypothetical protein